MQQTVGRRLRLAFQRSVAGRFPAETAATAARRPEPARGPLVDFFAYAEDCILFGRLRLDAERLTDMLNEHDEIQLLDVMVEGLGADGASVVPEMVVARDELLLVHATGPRGVPARRRRTRQHLLSMHVGPYAVRGYLHAVPGSEPLDAIRRRASMVPLTEATIDHLAGGAWQRRSVGTLVVNRERISSLARATEVAADALDLPAPRDPGPLVKDFTGSILGAHRAS